MRHNKTAAVTSREENQIKDLISLAYKVMLEQRKLRVTSHIYRERTYTLQSICSKLVAIPSHVVLEDLNKSLFEPLLTWLENLGKDREQEDKTSVFRPQRVQSGESSRLVLSEDSLTHSIKQTGCKIKVLWSTKEVDDSGWKPGWYSATVHNYCEESDILTIVYSLEPGRRNYPHWWPIRRLN